MLTVENLTISFRTDEGRVTPVQDVGFSLAEGRTLGIVGESGSGKSVSTKALMRLLPGNAEIGAQARMRYTAKSGEEIAIEALKPNARALRHLRGGEIGMIFQEPMASFSPVYTIGNQIMETIRLHRGLKGQAARDLAVEMLTKVGISNPDARVDQYPHELSGGMRQRAMIALALSAGPRLLIADEPTTALDVTIQAQVLDLMRDLQRDLAMGMIFITHDLGVIAHIADDVAVMYLGTIVETGTAREVLKSPAHPYTRGLIKAIPRADRLDARLEAVPGDIPSPSARPSGCPFHPRCAEAIAGLCDRATPPEVTLGVGRRVRCHLHETRAVA
ncbi:MAG: dipeptide/oligopeptide/nickel ABC transporter ATP-binding protein [Alphaproteobacteria bacterium HGW-Alphaproteobacteria-1]|jgi:oligopeptide/dipeptide ABC transporter ATP-binding protein|nr:MAG: dipeptide/oligopeptide/nickel ABC transporter ATP-binding protein [Alphaproteobacteria bacterium HGW-Alphaproteobacteria-1]